MARDRSHWQVLAGSCERCLRFAECGVAKGKFHPLTCREGIDGEYRYCPFLSLTSALDGHCATSRKVVGSTSVVVNEIFR